MNSFKRPQHFKLLIGLLLLFLCNPFTILCQSHDPHRGMQCGNFASFTPQSLNDGYPTLNINFSVLGNIGQLYEIRRALKDKDYLQVITLLLTVQPENMIETNYKTIYGKMESVLRYDSSLTPEDSLEIEEIANQLACEGGPAVYMARAILDEEYDDELTASLYKIRPATSTMEEVILFPNPTSGVVTISKDLSGYSGCSFDVFDFHGKHCFTSVLDVTIDPIHKDLSLLKNGIYFLSIHCDGINVETMKLIILK